MELPGKPSSYHLVNAFHEDGKGDDVATVVMAKLRDGGRPKLEAAFGDMMGARQERDGGGFGEIHSPFF